MLTGARVTAPDGFEQFPKGLSCYFLGNVKSRHRALFVRFEWSGRGQPASYIHAMDRDEFEEALDAKKLVISEGLDLPPWLAAREGVNFAAIDADRMNMKRSYRDMVDTRYLHIKPALDDLEAILAAEDVTAAINGWARRAARKQNESRFRLWFLTYLCFGQNIWALAPPFHMCGRWNRDTHSTKKQGPPSEAFGAGYGHVMTAAMRELCVQGYRKFVLPGRPMSDIYAEVMNKVFGCKRIRRRPDALEFFHPQGKAFPSLRQFTYQVKKALGAETIEVMRYGRARHRRTLAPSKGRFSEEVAYLLEKVEFDGYYTKERPRGYLEGSALPALCVVTARDMMTGAKVGIGFSFGAERADAYRMALFSMAVPKDFFCSLWGLKIAASEWSTVGLPASLKIDRGPGSVPRLAASDDAQPAMSMMAPSYSGQSKATVESSHPRHVKFEGEPEYVLSQLVPVELARREIVRVIGYNHTADMSSRMALDRELATVLPSPHALWNHYAAKLRTAGISMSVAEAVREFLKKMPLKVAADGVYLGDLRYDSEALRASGLLNRVAHGSSREEWVDGYMLSLCIRHIWVEVDGQLLMLDAMLPIREDEELLFISVAELQQWEEARARVRPVFAIHQAASKAEMLDMFEQTTGKAWDAGTRRSGRARKTAQAKQEAKEVMRHTAARRSA
ncbi:hypothetical protein [Burkholderia pseudomallei]|uniref:hypothetical protein n=1 Tax=Burkholderia pseudomallei TaxID=28450 RepID=UPI0005E57BC3|nr:hypothetical protein [Burkholderia pseudomallei]MBY7654632.1 hypothetical protein [Burkholderia pseudomallei]QUN84253.1 hypothetical protein KEX45_20450 [Burkholderia pseudomallei]QUN89203.1 hypothetical protein KEX46_27945 [Burkholderia pseudomallei]QUN96119.1 hypothetical protein KEX44_20540 [Burkholderia pseudomallei]QUO02150.1 hypothetical protein KEX42_20945 [Burkholderia pseudomallei]